MITDSAVISANGKGSLTKGDMQVFDRCRKGLHPKGLYCSDQRMRKEHDHKGGLPLLDDVQQNELQPNVITYSE